MKITFFLCTLDCIKDILRYLRNFLTLNSRQILSRSHFAGVNDDGLIVASVDEVSLCLERIYDIAGACSETDVRGTPGFQRNMSQGSTGQHCVRGRPDSGNGGERATLEIPHSISTNVSHNYSTTKCGTHPPFNDSFSQNDIINTSNGFDENLPISFDCSDNLFDGFEVPEDLDLQNPDLSLFDDFL